MRKRRRSRRRRMPEKAGKIAGKCDSLIYLWEGVAKAAKASA